MPETIEWRFPSNGGVKVNGLDTSDIESFKKDSMASLAREICQNSIDAYDSKNHKGDPVIVSFKSFVMSPKEIPGYTRLLDEVDNCIDYCKDDPKDGPELQEMQKCLLSNEINCLRISDFNTTGLLGVSDYLNDKSAWYSLIHGSGITTKFGIATGGSKGIGKYATFANSIFRTVFYSTNTIDNEVGYEGIAYLRTALIKGSEDHQKTQGMGFFACNDNNDAILNRLVLDKNFTRRESGAKGTDIYILGFRKQGTWLEDIVTKVLESFMVAIVRGRLVINVDDIVIDKDTIKDIVHEERFVSKKKPEGRSIMSQYILLSDEKNRFEDHITLELSGVSVGTIDLYMKELTGSEAEYATHKCEMIRYPYMKIKHISASSYDMNVSALAIINDDQLNATLKNIENPQHTDWESNRINDMNQRAAVNLLLHDMKNKISACITDHLSESSGSNISKIEGNAYFQDKAENVGQKNENSNESKSSSQHVTVTNKRVRTTEINLHSTDPEGNGVEIVPGIEDEEGDLNTQHPSGKNNGKGGGGGPGEEGGKGKETVDGNPVFSRVELKGTSYRFFCYNKEKGTYVLIFYAPEAIDNGDLELNRLDEAGDKTPIDIISCSINGKESTVENGKTIKLTLSQGQKAIVKITTPYKELFSAEVKLYRSSESQEMEER
jgi:hypothetical protein